LPKVKRAWSSVHRTVEVIVTTAFATAHGTVTANRGTAKPASTPTPPPRTTNRRNAARGPGAAGVAVAVCCARGDFVAMDEK
jgi:hypothetical protein